MQLDHLARVVLHDADAGDEVAVAQANFAAGRETEILLGRIFAKIVLFDVQDLGEWNGARAHGGIFGIIHRFHLVDLIVGIVVDHDAQRAQHGHDARGALVQILADEVFEQRELG